MPCWLATQLYIPGFNYKCECTAKNVTLLVYTLAISKMCSTAHTHYTFLVKGTHSLAREYFHSVLYLNVSLFCCSM